jgi:DNA polymerase III epsilon subunit-like protein
MEKILAYDCETGGLNPREHSLLTLYMAVFSQDRNGKLSLVQDLDLKIKPNDGEPYSLTAGAMKVNRIDIVKHDRDAVSINEAAHKVYYFLKSASDDGRTKLVPSGHNEPFDRGFVLNNLLKEEVWKLFVDYHNLDTVSLAKSMKMKNKLPNDLKLNLRSLAKHLGHSIPDSELHTAKGDTLLFVKVLESLLSML